MPGREATSARHHRDSKSRFIELITRRRRTVVAVTLLLVAASITGATRLRLNADFVTYLSAENPVVRAYHYVAEAFGGNETGVVLLTAPDVYRPEVLALIDSLTTTYEELDGVAYATGLTNTLEFSTTEWGIEVGRLVRRDAMPTTPAELAALRQRVNANPRLAGNLVSVDGTVAAIQLRLSAGEADGQSTTIATVHQVIGATEAIVNAPERASQVAAHFGGMPFLMYQIALQIVENMTILVPLMIGFLVLILYLGLRHWSGVVYPLVVVTVSSALVLGVMGVLGLPVDLLSGLVPIVLIVLGSADGIHYMKRYYERRQQGESAATAAAETYREIRVPLVLTTLTTMIAFGSLAMSHVAIIRQFGLLTALGLFAALVATLSLLPALAAFGLGAPPPRTTSGPGTLMVGISRVVTRAPRAVLMAGFGATAVVGLGAALIVKSVDWTLCLKRGSPPHRAELQLRHKLGGSLPIQLLVRGDLLDPGALLTMRTLERRLNALPSVSKSQSLAGLVAEMNAAMNGRYAIPQAREGVANLWLLVEDEDAIEQLVARGAPDEGLIQARVADWETRSIRDAVEGIDQWLAAHMPAVAIDVRRLSPAAASAIQGQRVVLLRTELEWEFAGRGVAAPASLALAATTFGEWQVDAVARSAIDSALRRYLASAEAEASVAPPAAERLAGVLADAVTALGIDSARAGVEVRRSLPDVDPNVREALALSLAQVTNEAMGRRRVADAMATLAAVPALHQDAALRRDVRGVFWEALGPLVVASDSTAARWGLVGSDAVHAVPVRVSRSGLASVLDRMEAELLPTQLQSVVVTLVVVGVLLSLMFQSPVAGVVMAVPLMATIAVNFGAMGYLSLGLDSFTAMVASIAIGLGVDYAIHFTHRLRRELARVGGRMTDALTSTLRTSGVAILVNAASVGLGFLVLLAATCQHIRRFGGLTSLAMLVAGSLTLFLLPALYLWGTPRFLAVRD